MEIKISKCAAKCCACESVFDHEEKVHSLVVAGEDSLARQDYCAKCIGEAPREEVYCAWNVRFCDPKVLEAEQQEALSPLRRLFYDLAVLEQRDSLAQAYLAAQLLKRQKVFRQIKEAEDADGAGKVILFLDRLGNRLIEARDLNFTYTELDDARVQLMARLQELETPPDAPEEQEPVKQEDNAAEQDNESQPAEQVEEHVQTTTS